MDGHMGGHMENTRAAEASPDLTQSLTGKQIWEDRVFSPILDENGNVDCIMESVRDITRLKNLEVDADVEERLAALKKKVGGTKSTD